MIFFGIIPLIYGVLLFDFGNLFAITDNTLLSGHRNT